MNPGEAMLEALKADGPDAALAEELRLFGQFVGSWDLAVINYQSDGTERRLNGEWHFGWVLEGRAIQDVWIAPRRSLRSKDGPPAGDYGATLRFYDPTIKAWRSTWIGPVRGLVLPFVARQAGEEIVLEGSFEAGVRTRWIFSRITGDAFHWRHLESRDEGRTERLRQEMFAARVA